MMMENCELKIIVWDMNVHFRSGSNKINSNMEKISASCGYLIIQNE